MTIFMNETKHKKLRSKTKSTRIPLSYLPSSTIEPSTVWSAVKSKPHGPISKKKNEKRREGETKEEEKNT